MFLGTAKSGSSRRPTLDRSMAPREGNGMKLVDRIIRHVRITWQNYQHLASPNFNPVHQCNLQYEVQALLLLKKSEPER